MMFMFHVVVLVQHQYVHPANLVFYMVFYILQNITTVLDALSTLIHAMNHITVVLHQAQVQAAPQEQHSIQTLVAFVKTTSLYASLVQMQCAMLDLLVVLIIKLLVAQMQDAIQQIQELLVQAVQVVQEVHSHFVVIVQVGIYCVQSGSLQCALVEL